MVVKTGVRRRMTVGVLTAACCIMLPGVAVAQAAPAQTAVTAQGVLDREVLRGSLDAMVEAGMYGVYSAVRDGREEWKGASGVADVRTRRPVQPHMRHRVGSITKTFTAVAVLKLVEQGKIELDAPIGRYLPELVPGERGQRVTVRMLLNHTSGIADYILPAYPSFLEDSPRSLDENRFRTFSPRELIRLGLEAPPTTEPGEKFAYSNTNYIILGELLHKVTRVKAEDYITRHVIRPAGLRHTYFPRTPFIQGPHSKAYEGLYGLIDPPKDYSVYTPTIFGPAGALISTMEDLNRFYRLLLGGKLLRPAELAEMKTTVPVYNENGQVVMNYGLGLYNLDLGCGAFWGHDGGVWGMGTQALSTEDGSRQLAMGFNLMKYQQIDENGQLITHPIDYAMGAHMVIAACSVPEGVTTLRSPERAWVPPMIDRISIKR
ncbi:serine hydrolase domain-containing protein [Thermostaphylospora chromogena]|uniref:D-alanyl-D-alanine carboxypeptidase n=1 Tax=Thermostaphylospora chromogena TaxID=35622 RepID=A0A1H1DKU9_9ACTN|nr:serine hydrolase domain-containing protein [Thermostaphylospora chromogena]SDQ76869.1 D-alanyl-D-alanine carboxypeptidase [Thermostaphylospora chromogena]